MNSPNIDRASVALSKKLMAKVRADAAAEMQKRMQCVSGKERAKLNSLLNNIQFLGEVGKAMAKSRVSRKLLDKWMNMPGVSWHINTAFNKAQALLHCGRTPEDVLWWAKIAPELEKDAENFRATGQRRRESRVIAKLAARNLKDYRWHIVQAAAGSNSSAPLWSSCSSIGYASNSQPGAFSRSRCVQTIHPIASVTTIAPISLALPRARA
jgi:hypothetical protein